MTPEWQEKIDAEQSYTHTEINGKLFPRVRYGSDHPGVKPPPRCADCGCAIGQIHVDGCTVERCASCGRQAFGCPCDGSKAH